MKESFADISGEQRESAYSERARQERGHQERLFSSKPPDLVEAQHVRVHIDRACRKEQNQLEERMIQHVEKSSGGCGGGFRTENRNHADARQNETDLRNGGAGKRALQVDGKQGEHRTKHHRNGTQNENHGTPFRIRPEQIAGNGGHAENAGFRQDTGQKRGSRRRGDRVCFRKPDMKREHACLGTEPEQYASSCGIQEHLLSGLGSSFIKKGYFCGPEFGLQEEQPHESGHASYHGYGKIGIRRFGSLFRLILYYPGIRRKGHDLKKDQSREQVGREENAHRCAKRHEVEEEIPSAVCVVREITSAEQRGHEPRKGDDYTVNLTESVRCKGQTESAYAGKRSVMMRNACKKDRRGKFDKTGGTEGQISCGCAFPGGKKADGSHEERKQDQEKEHILHPLLQTGGRSCGADDRFTENTAEERSCGENNHGNEHPPVRFGHVFNGR